MEKGTISVVIPMYNAEEYVPCMIKSILSQTYPHFEVHIIDDHSTDRSLAVIQEMVQEDDRFHVDFRPDELPKGAQSCRNYGTQYAKGEYLIYLDADDWIAPYCFEQRVAFMEVHKELDFAVFPMLGMRRKPFELTGMVIGYGSMGNDLDNLICRTLPFVVVSNIYRLSNIRKINLIWDFRLKSLQDSDFNMTAIAHGACYKLSYGKPDYFYRVLGNTTSIGKKIYTESHAESHLYFLQKQWSRFGGQKNSEKGFMVLLCFLFKLFLEFMSEAYCSRLLESEAFIRYPKLVSKFKRLVDAKSKKMLSHGELNHSILRIAPIFALRYKWVYFRWGWQQKFQRIWINLRYFALGRELNELYNNLLQ